MTVCVLCITVEGLDYGDHTVRVRAARAEGDAAEARAMPERGGLQLPFYRGPPRPARRALPPRLPSLAFCRPSSLRRRRRQEEVNILAQWVNRRGAAWSTVDTGGAHSDNENSIESGVTALECPIALIVVQVRERHPPILPDNEADC